MTDTNEEALQEAKNDALFPADRDWLLASMIRIFSNNGIDMGITLNVHGSVISGNLISGKKYLAEMATKFSELAEGKDFYKTLENFFSGYLPIYDATSEDEEGVPVDINYIHLRNAKVFSPGGSIPTGKGELWRGRLDAVNGFTFGQLQAD